MHRQHVEELEEELGAARGRAAALGHAMWGHGMRQGLTLVHFSAQRKHILLHLP